MHKEKLVPSNGTETGRLSTAAKANGSCSGTEILENAARVTSGLESENRFVDESTAQADGLTESLKETATQANSVASSADDIVSAINEIAESAEQIRTNT